MDLTSRSMIGINTRLEFISDCSYSQYHSRDMLWHMMEGAVCILRVVYQLCPVNLNQELIIDEG